MKRLYILFLSIFYSCNVKTYLQDAHINLRNPVVQRENTQERIEFLDTESIRLKNQYEKKGCNLRYLKEMKTVPHISLICRQLRTEYLQNRRLAASLIKSLFQTSENINGE